MVPEKLYAKEWNWTLILHHIQKLTQNGIKGLKVRAKVIKLSEESTGEKLHDMGFGNYFLDMTPKTQGSKETKEMFGLHQN